MMHEKLIMIKLWEKNSLVDYDSDLANETDRYPHIRNMFLLSLANRRWSLAELISSGLASWDRSPAHTDASCISISN